MIRSRKKLSSMILASIMLVGVLIPNIALAEESELHLTILGTSDIHGNIYNWSYENERETDGGLVRVATIVDKIRKENPNTILLDNGDLIQGTILTDDLYNLNPKVINPMIDSLNFIKYDAMVLGNHEFNFGLETIDKLVEEANFPILAANMYNKDGSNYTKPYTIIERAGVKIGVIGLTHWNIHQWDGPKVQDIDFKRAKDEFPKYIDELNDKADIIIAAVHEGLESDEDANDLKDAIKANPKLAAVLIGHDHELVDLHINDTLVGGPRNEGKDLVRMDLYLEKQNNEWIVKDSKLEIIETKDFEPSKELLEYTKKYHDGTIEFIQNPIGHSTGAFHPESEVKGIPEAQLRDTPVINLINKVQMKYANSDIAAASLFDIESNILEGDVSYKDLFSIYKYANTLVGVEMTGRQFKDYMEWTSQYYNQYKDGDVTISFKPGMRPYNYDNFMGVEYKIDISQPVGERIVDLKRNGKDIKDDEILKVAVNSHKHGVLITEGFLTREPYYTSDPASLRSLIAEHVKESKIISPEVENNWEVIGADLSHPLRDWIIGEVNAGRLEIPTVDERSYNSVSLNVYELIAEGKIPKEVLNQHKLDETGKPLNDKEVAPKPDTKPEEKPDTVEKYTVKNGDMLWKIARQFGKTWEELAEFNSITNPHLIYPGQVIKIAQ